MTRKWPGSRRSHRSRLRTPVAGLLSGVLLGGGALYLSQAAHPNEQTTQLRGAPMTSRCHPSYQGQCVPKVRDVDCIGGNGRGPFVGRVKVVGPDVYRLDDDGDGIGCE
jgi:hypothetical protein